jgi:hypothetical protein
VVEGVGLAVVKGDDGDSSGGGHGYGIGGGHGRHASGPQRRDPVEGRSA